MSAIAELPWRQWLAQQRWYAGRNRTLSSAQPQTTIKLGEGLDLVLVDATYADGPSERYQVVVQWDSRPLAEYGQLATIGTVEITPPTTLCTRRIRPGCCCLSSTPPP